MLDPHNDFGDCDFSTEEYNCKLDELCNGTLSMQYWLEYCEEMLHYIMTFDNTVKEARKQINKTF